jgi:hypothetical protein
MMILLVFLGLLHLSVQQDDQQQRDQTLTRETVDAILQILSPNCRAEMEAALDSQTEISMNCKFEIQNAIPQLLSPEDQELHRKQQERYDYEMDKQNGDKQRQQRREKRREREIPEEETISGGTSPEVLLGGLFTAIIAGIIGIMMYFRSSRNEDVSTPKKVKKIVKKKVSKSD